MKIEIEIIPFDAPDVIVLKTPPRPRHEGFNLNNSVMHVSEVDAETLSKLCNDFRAEVFKKAGKIDPYKQEIFKCSDIGLKDH